MEGGTLSARFAPMTENVVEARRLLRSLPPLIAPATIADLEVIVSELASNAITHARTPFEVRVRTGDTVRIEVIDGSPMPPEMRRPSYADPSGRGLLIVDAYSDDWGYDLLPGGKVVWAQLSRRRHE